MSILYNIAICISPFFIWIGTFFSKKIKLFFDGRKGLIKRIEKEFGQYNKTREAQEQLFWFHCSSVGEFEQARPVIEWCKGQIPTAKIVLTFFSPSGYELRKNYNLADWVYYLPMDTSSNARRFLNVIKPNKVIFTKYDLWSNYIKEAKKIGAQITLISAIFRKEQSFFKWWGGFFRAMLKKFSVIFVQDERSKELLQSIGIEANVYVAGDTRFDRVERIANESKEFVAIKQFIGSDFSFVVGSSWIDDELIIADVIKNFKNLKMVIAPHEVGNERIKKVEQIFEKMGVVKYSQIESGAQIDNVSEHPQEIFAEKKVMIIDCIGILSSLYKYADLSYIGGGFGVGIHNVLEAAVYGSPVAFGPNYKKFKEAVDLVHNGGATVIENTSGLYQLLDTIIKDREIRKEKGDACRDYVQSNLGATAKIVKEIFRNN